MLCKNSRASASECIDRACTCRSTKAHINPFVRMEWLKCTVCSSGGCCCCCPSPIVCQQSQKTASIEGLARIEETSESAWEQNDEIGFLGLPSTIVCPYLISQRQSNKSVTVPLNIPTYLHSPDGSSHVVFVKDCVTSVEAQQPNRRQVRLTIIFCFFFFLVFSVVLQSSFPSSSTGFIAFEITNCVQTLFSILFSSFIALDTFKFRPNGFERTQQQTTTIGLIDRCCCGLSSVSFFVIQ